jgi:2-polyprenyl-3-methyl-5-hydroxy-6-metoxy-1,4-benzoquinol methylase
MRKADHLPKDPPVRGTILFPSPGQKVYDESIPIAGTIIFPSPPQSGQTIRAWLGDVGIGQTRILRKTASAENQFEYKLLAKWPDPIAEARSVSLTISLGNEATVEKVAEVAVELVPARLRERHYGEVVPPGESKVLHRENIYGSGPPIEEASPEILDLLRGYLDPPSSIVDVGCGAGAFAPGLAGSGHTWLGLEVDERCIEILKRRQLPYRKLTPGNSRWPCVDREFDNAICIEVLEHIAEPAPFLSEIARITRQRALFSVPNMEVIPYFQDWQAVPWHLLEATHLNFFTRASLRALLEQHFRHVEVISYGEHPLRTRDDVPLHLHLFAVAESISPASSREGTL